METLDYFNLENIDTKLQSLRQQYPTIYTAWRSMCGNNTVDIITPKWRGKLGCVQFIIDTCSSYVDGAKLKRRDSRLPFSPANVYWKLPINKERIMKKQVHAITFDLEELASKYPTQESREERINELFSASLTEHFTPSMQLELEILTDSLITGEINVPIKEAVTKYTDI